MSVDVGPLFLSSMKQKTAIMIDGGFLRKRLFSKPGNFPTAATIRDFAHGILRSKHEELFRIYYYDCMPFSQTVIHPLTGKKIHYGQSDAYIRGKLLIDELKKCDYFAVREGFLSYNGDLSLRRQAIREIKKTKRSVKAEDLKLELKQKGVDIKIGLDLSWLSSKKLVDKIILVGGDADFIPAMKHARREGVIVVLVTLGSRNINPNMVIHCDEYREVNTPLFR